MEKEKSNAKFRLQKIEKPLIFCLFSSMILVFVYSLIFMTPFYNLYILNGVFSASNMANFGFDISKLPEASYVMRNDKIFGVDMAYFTNFARNGALQVYNHTIFNLGFFGILVVALIFLFRGNKRKTYYLSNYITFGLSSLYVGFVGVYLFIETNTWQSYIESNVNFDLINAYQSDLNLKESIINYYSAANFNWIFVVGYVLALLVIIFALIGVIFVILKIIYQKKHPAIDISGVLINE